MCAGRVGRRRLQPSVDDARIHADVPLLERDQTSPIRSSQCVSHVHHSALVEHCQRWDNRNTSSRINSLWLIFTLSFRYSRSSRRTYLNVLANTRMSHFYFYRISLFVPHFVRTWIERAWPNKIEVYRIRNKRDTIYNSVPFDLFFSRRSTNESRKRRIIY